MLQLFAPCIWGQGSQTRVTFQWLCSQTSRLGFQSWMFHCKYTEIVRVRTKSLSLSCFSNAPIQNGRFENPYHTQNLILLDPEVCGDTTAQLNQSRDTCPCYHWAGLHCKLYGFLVPHCTGTANWTTSLLKQFANTSWFQFLACILNSIQCTLLRMPTTRFLILLFFSFHSFYSILFCSMF